jgi:hypothetical protein
MGANIVAEIREEGSVEIEEVEECSVDVEEVEEVEEGSEEAEEVEEGSEEEVVEVVARAFRSTNSLLYDSLQEGSNTNS